ncbi:hypothetical protein M569_13490, partial [Genlisea aurea]
QIKDMVLKASAAYKSCKPCSGSMGRHGGWDYVDTESGSVSARFYGSYARAELSNPTSRIWGKDSDAKLKAFSSGSCTPASASCRTESVFIEEYEPKEWTAQVESGVLITFVSSPHGGNDLKKIRFSRDLFDKRQAQQWWAENYEKLMELYNVRRFSHQSSPKKVTIIATATGCVLVSIQDSNSRGVDESPHPANNNPPRVSSSSIDGRTSSSSVSNESDLAGNEWVEQDELGVYITIGAKEDGRRELRRVRFSRERFGERQARAWWEQNKARIQRQYL